MGKHSSILHLCPVAAPLGCFCACRVPFAVWAESASTENSRRFAYPHHSVAPLAQAVWWACPLRGSLPPLKGAPRRCAGGPRPWTPSGTGRASHRERLPAAQTGSAARGSDRIRTAASWMVGLIACDRSATILSSLWGKEPHHPMSASGPLGQTTLDRPALDLRTPSRRGNRRPLFPGMGALRPMLRAHEDRWSPANRREGLISSTL